ncbi:hypothetical protein OS493_028395 [Desmophyllum pertusum]|uniref:URB1 C-terminal domain-containing protein n=1 Tax=Desmophyllum pertusum TaxID=174260 RepID=A0A9W9ZZA9_9CNID|nr:hypothetical protein OS493_028395 [Desmophyllum pertusum]
MKDSPDYYLYKRRHVIELALSYHDSPVSDHHSQNLVTQLLLSALKIHPAAYDLTKNYGIVAWIHSLCYKSKSSKDEEEKSVRLPPSLAQECALVCWTLLGKLRSSPGASDTYKYLQLLASIIPYLAANEQPSGLSCDRILSLLCLWCAAFEETVVLSQLLSPLNLNEMLSSAGQTYAPRTDCEYIKLKTESLSSLLALLASWQPSGVGTNQTSLQQIVSSCLALWIDMLP